jgi:hypothetical protein
MNLETKSVARRVASPSGTPRRRGLGQKFQLMALRRTSNIFLPASGFTGFFVPRGIVLHQFGRQFLDKSMAADSTIFRFPVDKCNLYGY